MTEETPYTIMFGPEKCGSEYKYHFVIRYRDPETGIITEHHAKQPTESFEAIFSDVKTHLFKLGLFTDLNRVHIYSVLIHFSFSIGSEF